MKNNEQTYIKGLLEQFIKWAQENSPDAWWIYENTDEAIEEFLRYLDK